MKESSQQLLINAEETLNAAEVLLKEEYLRDAVNRAYYSVFHMLGDYDEVARFNSKEVSWVIERAWDFLNAAKKYLASQP